MAPSKLAYVAGGAVASYAAFRYLDAKHHIVDDLYSAKNLLSFKKKVNELYALDTYNVADMWYATLKKNPKKKCLVMIEDSGDVRPFTFRDVENESNKVSNYALNVLKMKRGDTVALFMENRPEFVITWLGFAKCGIKVAMINTAIKEKGLVHCIRISGAKAVIFGAELAGQMSSVADEIRDSMNARVVSFQGELGWCECGDQEVQAQSDKAVPASMRSGIKMTDTFGYIYTSGTTGLPKAAVILHSKMFAFGNLMVAAFGVSESDVCLTVLPLFHSAGGGLGIGMMIATGCTVVLRKKFSAKNFFEDAAKHKVTVVQYIGELCRYLLQTPKGKFDRKHRVQIAIGNGLRPEIWDEFQTRFNIPEIGEFYGSTEGNSALVNHCTTKEAQGACGRMGTLLRKISGVRIVKFNVEEEECVRRGPNNFCVEADVDEAGEMLFPIRPNDPSTAFAGYESKEATEKKLIRDVFVKGDMYFRTGDLLSMNSGGFFKFVDRIGDTFRWKGENCSTTEVTEVMATFPGVEEVNVYGVQIPNNQDGRAPCAAITPVDGEMSNLNLDEMAAFARKNLPEYAVPLFLRITPQIAVTATMKHQKVALRKAGIDIAVVPDPLYILEGKTYVPLDGARYARITTPGARL